MSSVEVVAAAQERFVQLKERHRATVRAISDTEKSIGSYQGKHILVLKSTELLGKALETMKSALVPLTAAGLGRLEGLLTKGLQTIFFDRDYSIDIVVADRGKDKTAEFFLIEKKASEVLRTEMRDSIGGGVQSISGLILQVFFIIHYRMRRILILDEPFGDINDKYIEGIFSFLRYLINDMGFSILMVSHDTKYNKFSDVLYEIKDGKARVCP